MLHASADDYVVVLTSGATAAIKLVRKNDGGDSVSTLVAVASLPRRC